MQSSPSISVVIPVYNAADYLRSCLEALQNSSIQPLECIVVDDGSTDESPAVAAEFGAKVLSSGGRRGPAAARNIGAKAASGDLLFFIDSDVCAHTDTLRRIVDAFAADPELAGLIGSYDDTPQSRDFLSAYRNLMHAFVHQHGNRQASTFWSGCGAIRRTIFLEHNGFDEGYGRPAIEDIELGYRLAAAGRKLVLDHNVLVKHLKQWTFRNLLKTDIMDRGIPWTELILSNRRLPNDLNVQVSQRISVALAFLLFGLATAGALYYGGYLLVPMLAILLLACYWIQLKRQSRTATLVVTASAIAFAWLAYSSHMLSLIPPVLIGYVLLFLRRRYACSSPEQRRWTGMVYAVYLVCAVIFIVALLPAKLPLLGLYLIVFAIVILNSQFYLYLGPRMGWVTTLAVIPFHLLYYFYSGISFLAGFSKHAWKSVRPGQLRPAAGDTRR